MGKEIITPADIELKNISFSTIKIQFFHKM